jgi:DNA polymerase III subunit beta
MKLIVIRDNLKMGLSVVSGAEGNNQNLPILKNLLIEVDDNRIKLIATNLEMAVSYMISGKVIEKGRVTVPISTILSLISGLQSERINLEGRKGILEVKTDNFQGTIQSLPVEDFPLIPKIKNHENYIILDGELLKDSLVSVLAGTQNSDLRPELNNILFDFNIDNLKIVATDGFRLAEKTITSNQIKTTIKEPFRMLVPLKTAQELVRSISDESISIIPDNSQVLFKNKDLEIISRLSEGNFPDYDPIIPKKFGAEVIIKTSEFLGAVKSAAVFGGRSSEVKLAVRENKKGLDIFSGDAAIGEGFYTLPAKTKGIAEDVGFNWRYLVDGAKTIRTEEFLLGVNDDNKPAIIKSPNDTSFFYIVMPILKA